MRRVGLCLLALLAAASAFSPAWAESFDTRLSPSPLTDGTRINITGQGQALVEWDGNILQSGGQAHTLLPGIHHPNNGNGIFVFALPDN